MKRIIAMLITLAILSAALSGCGLSTEEIKALEAQIPPTAAPVRASKEKERATPAMAVESPTQGHREATPRPTSDPLPAKEDASSPDLPTQPPQEAKPAEKNSVSRTPAPTPEGAYPFGFVIQAPEPPPAAQEWPYITAPEPPTYTPEPEPTEPPQEQPAPTPEPEPAEPAPEPTEQPAAPTPEAEPTPTPAGGYAVCSCGAALTPEEVLPHMKAHAMNGESHSYRAY